MKYTYKQTGVIVESDIPLDSANFTPISEKQTEAETEAMTSKSTVAPAKKTASTRRK